MVKKLLPIFISLLIINSCATYVNVKIQKPASISLGDVKNVAVMDIEDDEFIGSYLFTEVGDAPLREKLDIIIEGKKKPKIPDLKMHIQVKLFRINLLQNFFRMVIILLQIEINLIKY